MQRQNLNQQTSSYRKRKCIVYKPNSFFDSFDKSQHELISHYQKSAEQHMIKSLAILIQNIRKCHPSLQTEPSSPKSKNSQDKNHLMSMLKNPPPTFKKKFSETIVEEDQASDPEKEIRELIHFQKTGKKIDKNTQNLNYCLEQKEPSSNPKQQRKHEKLMKSMQKLSISENDVQQNMNNNLLEPDFTDLQNKTLAELIYSTNTKKDWKNEQNPPMDSEDSEYEVTDHSSNESSNDEDNYQERFAFDTDQKPLFGTIFAQGGKNYKCNPNYITDSQSSINQPKPKLNFKPILDSPKKSPSKRKRVYVNKKRVPRWAQDLQKVAQVYGSEEQRKLRSQFNQIFGICIVQNMQTNVIFNRNDVYARSSTVKWDNKAFFQ